MKNRVPSPAPIPSVPPEDEEIRRGELCLQLAENLHDLGACEFTQELSAGDGKFLIRVVRYETTR